MSTMLLSTPEPDSGRRAAPVPGYLVLLPKGASAWSAVETMTGATRKAARHEVGSSAEILPAPREGQARIHIYEAIGAVAMDLDTAECSELERQGALIVENVIMRAPPPLPGDEAQAFRGGPVSAAAAGAATTTWGISVVGADTSAYQGRGIRVAVLDTGIDRLHPEFAGAVVAERSFVPGVPSVQDGDGHGTHVAGTIGARLGHPVRYSVAPLCELIVAKVLDDEGSGYTQWIVDGMNWAALEARADILNLSLGGSRAHNGPYNRFYEEVADRLLDLGVLTIAAAGNASNRPHMVAPVGNPAACPSVEAVVAVNHDLTIARFSCAGDDVAKPDHSGPGVDIYSSWPGGRHHTISGTSMATPHVAGLAALHAEHTGLRGRALQQALRDNSARRPLGSVDDFGLGLTTAP